MSNPENIKLISRFESAILNLNDREWEYPFGTFLWETNEQGAFSIEKIVNFQEIPEEKYFFRDKETNKYKEIFDLLDTSISEFTIYLLSFSMPDAYKVGFKGKLITQDNHPSIFDFEFPDWIIGKTLENYWLAIGKVTGEPLRSKKEPLPSFRRGHFKQNTLEFFNELENTLKNFYPDKYVWEIYPTKEGVLKRIFNSTRFIVARDFDGFESRFDFDELNDLPSGYLSHILQENLINITEYKFCDYYFYIIGQTHWGDWAGIWTHEPWN